MVSPVLFQLASGGREAKDGRKVVGRKGVQKDPETAALKAKLREQKKLLKGVRIARLLFVGKKK